MRVKRELMSSIILDKIHVLFRNNPAQCRQKKTVLVQATVRAFKHAFQYSRSKPWINGASQLMRTEFGITDSLRELPWQFERSRYEISKTVFSEKSMRYDFTVSFVYFDKDGRFVYFLHLI